MGGKSYLAYVNARAYIFNYADFNFDSKYVFDGSALYGGHKSGEEFYLAPDLDTFVILPWRPQQGKVARFLCDVYNEDGAASGLSPRTILKNVIQEAIDSLEGKTIITIAHRLSTIKNCDIIYIKYLWYLWRL